MNYTIKNLAKDSILTLVLAVSFSGFYVGAFLFKSNLEIYLFAIGLSSFFFSYAIKTLKNGLIYLCISCFLGSILSYILIILPPKLSGEEFMVSYTTDVYVHFLARMFLLSLPVILIAFLIGCILTDSF